MQVLPVVISEEVIRNTLDGKKVTYLIKRDQTSKVYNLSEIDGNIYNNIAEVKNALIKNATHAINEICNIAKKSSEAFVIPTDLKPSAPKESQNKSLNIPTDDDIKSFVLDNGTRVNVNMGDI